MAITKIKKRNGSLVDFDPQKIITAVGKAFSDVRKNFDPEKIKLLTDSVLADLETIYTDRSPGVENVQDFVEKQLMQDGYYDVAKTYILYRYEHAKIRAEKKKELLEKIEKNEINVKKANGQTEQFSMDKLRHALSFAMVGLEPSVDAEIILAQCRSELYDGISTSDINRALIMTARTMIEQDPAYATVASRLLLFTNYKEFIGADKIDWQKLAAQYRAAFIQNIKRGVEIERLDPRLLAFDLERLAAALVIERDDLFIYMGLQTLYDRYFVRDTATKLVLETPQTFWMRIAMGSALLEKENRHEKTIQFYGIMSRLLYTPSTPTLFHAGTPKPQLSSCYLNTVSDSLDNIFKTYADNAQLSKWSGGIGTDWTNLRGTGAYIKGTGVESQGVIPFLKIANDVTVAINRSGRRRGAACVYLECWHYDVEAFLELRKNTGDERRRTHDMDTANWIPDLFMKRVKEDGDWTLFSPEETPDLHHIYGRAFEDRYAMYEKRAAEGKIALFKKLKARDLWKKMLAMLFETGHPWITFKDAANVRSPQDHIGVVHNSNLCTEITLNTSENETAVCNLGSLNLAKFVTNSQFDVELIKEVVPVAMRMLDNVIDINYYPTEDSKRSNLRHRPVGLGLRGFQDALYQLGINFDSEACVAFSDSSMETISYYAYLASSELARERGAYESYRGSKWDRGLFPQDTIDLLEKERGEIINVARGGQMDWTPVRQAVKLYGLRNSNCLAVAPTATTANIVGCVPTVEPIYKNLYVKSNQAGDFVVINAYLVEDLKKLNLWDYEMLGKIKYHDGSIAQISEIPEPIRAKYKEVFEIDSRWLIKAAAYRAKWIDQSQSLNIFFRSTSGKELSDVYTYAWEMGLKTTYYLRTLAASQVEKSTVSTKEFGSTHHRRFAPEAAGATVSTASVTSGLASPSEPTASSAAPSSPPMATTTKPLPVIAKLKVCSIDDPSCESCQG
ncbi:MAG: ribonucleoside-diphosphate reductase subunit alpha [Candidatus Magasanikbacteria bacterium]|nr:ribonucleoside-diphosphate reductase subunit alpha [Candidatus Magasanikbacteria bacterium]